MKTFVSLLLCLLLCLPLLAVAEDVQYEWYTDPAGRYSFAYPVSWTVLSRDTLEENMDIAETVDDEEFVTLMQSVREQVLTTDMVMVMSENMTSNINLIPQEVDQTLDGGLLLELGAQLQELLASQMTSIEYPLDPYLIELNGGQSALAVEYTYPIAGYEIYGVQTMHTRGSILYTITLTSDPGNVQADIEALGLVLGSLTVH